MPRQVFVDMDGVLADFDQHHFDVFGVRSSKLTDNVDWNAVRAIPNFYLHIPPMPDMGKLWDGVTQLTGCDPTVLTGVPSSVKEAPANKRAWVAKNIGPHVKVLTVPSKDKAVYCTPGDVLIDDWDRYKHRWERVGGVFIVHQNAAASLDALRKVWP